MRIFETPQQHLTISQPPPHPSNSTLLQTVHKTKLQTRTQKHNHFQHFVWPNIFLDKKQKMLAQQQPNMYYQKTIFL